MKQNMMSTTSAKVSLLLQLDVVFGGPKKLAPDCLQTCFGAFLHTRFPLVCLLFKVMANDANGQQISLLFLVSKVLRCKKSQRRDLDRPQNKDSEKSAWHQNSATAIATPPPTRC